ERLHRGHHAHMAHRLDVTSPHGAVEDLVVFRAQAGRVHDVTVLGHVLDDRLDLLLLVTQVLQRARDGLVDDLHGAATDQLLELARWESGSAAGGAAFNLEAVGVVADQAVGPVGDVVGHRVVEGGPTPPSSLTRTFSNTWFRAWASRS